jgi:hypothetical protein
MVKLTQAFAKFDTKLQKVNKKSVFSRKRTGGCSQNLVKVPLFWQICLLRGENGGKKAIFFAFTPQKTKNHRPKVCFKRWFMGFLSK